MHRPPRPQIKSSKIITRPTQRKTMTPDFLFQQLQQCPKQSLRSMRDTINPSVSEMHRSMNQVENIEYLQITRNNHLSSINVSHDRVNNAAIGRSFKIRNFGTLKTRAKQNTIPLKIKSRPLHGTQNFQVSKAPQNPPKQILKLQNYPQDLHLQHIGSKIGYHFIHEAQPQSEVNNWCFIVSQSIFYGPILSETNLLKLRYLVENLTRQYPRMKVLLRLYSSRNTQYIANTLKEREINITGVIWSKQKYFETINSFDLSEIFSKLGTSRYIVVEDQHEITKNIYFQHAQYYEHIRYSIHVMQRDTEKQNCQYQRNIDFNCKYLYIKLQGLANFVRFCQNLQIDEQNDQICVQKVLYKDQTAQLVGLEELIQKIRIFGVKKICQLNKTNQEKKSKQLNSSNPKKNEESNNDLKSKLLQYSKLIENECKKERKSKRQNSEVQVQKCSKSSTKKGQANNLNANLVRLMNPFAGLKQDFVNEQSKSVSQFINQLVKNNVAANKQINKFREKAEKLMLQFTN